VPIPHVSILIGLTLLGLLSPLLTFAKLFQMKEWRWDRLREHLRREGWISQLFSTARLVLLCVTLPALTVLPLASLLLGVLGLFALVSLAQIGLRRQRYPVWTQKARMIVALALLLSGLAVWASLVTGNASIALPLLIVGQPAFVFAAWALLLPLDSFLKKRVMDRAAAIRRAHPEATVIGIAGSVGKTTTKELIKHLLQDLSPIATPAHVNTEMGVAQWLLSKFETRNSKLEEAEARMSNVECRMSSPIIVEMGAYRLGEVALLSRIAQPTVGVLTHLGSDHLALFGSEDAIRRANAELIEALPKDGHAFIAVNDDASAAIAAAAPCAVTTIGDAKQALHASHAEDQNDGLHVTVEHHGLHLPMHGMHNVVNLLLACGVARRLGISWDRIRELLPSFRSISHTFTVMQERGVTMLDDTYNISFLSMQAALEWARKRPERPRVLLTNGLLEVGDAEDHYHARLGEIANGAVERAVFLNPKAAKAFGSTFKGEVSGLESAGTVEKGSLLLCVGRLPLSVIQKLLP
jgi:UDP-N-acetylmuramyl pentapeptide synthase